MLKFKLLTASIAVIIVSMASQEGTVQALPGCFGDWYGLRKK